MGHENLDYRPGRFPPLMVRVRGRKGVRVRITSVAKTLAGCFKYRNKVGLDVALAALKDAWRDRRVRLDEIDCSARVCWSAG